jgi:hypothetical protein
MSACSMMDVSSSSIPPRRAEERSLATRRFAIALILCRTERAADPMASRRPAFVYVDEAADYFDDTIDTLLIQARKCWVGLTVAHQFLDQLTPALRASVDQSRHSLCRRTVGQGCARLGSDMRTSPSSHAHPKAWRETEFAAFVPITRPPPLR